MKVNFKAQTNIVDFRDLMCGTVFSYDDHSGLFLKTDDDEAFDFQIETFVDFGPLEKVVKRKISVAIEDDLPFQD